MNWRATWSVLAGLLLPMPLVLLLSPLLYPALTNRADQEARVSPILDVEERTRRVTYHRRCTWSSDCEPPLGCLMDARARAHYCTDSQCTTDQECPEGQRCEAIATNGKGPLVRFCIPLGVRQEGERCAQLPDTQEGACAPDLVCGGRDGWCTHPCRPGDASGCAEGFFCADVWPEPVCLPTCEARGCPEGQHCVRHSEGASSCAKVYGPMCQQTPCEDGRECSLLYAARLPGIVWMECVERCGEKHQTCSPGRVCDRWHCMPPCEPEGPNTCAEGYVCHQRAPSRPWVCEPDYW
ncbi:hypothetical protein P2318_00525 [Myxococcaceae bacterium GXIMD 01537]